MPRCAPAIRPPAGANDEGASRSRALALPTQKRFVDDEEEDDYAGSDISEAGEEEGEEEEEGEDSSASVEEESRARAERQPKLPKRAAASAEGAPNAAHPGRTASALTAIRPPPCLMLPTCAM